MKRKKKTIAFLLRVKEEKSRKKVELIRIVGDECSQSGNDDGVPGDKRMNK